MLGPMTRDGPVRWIAAALAALAAAWIFAPRAPAPVPAVRSRPAPVEAWPAPLRPIAGGVRLELESPRCTDIMVTPWVDGHAGAPRTIARTATAPLDFDGLEPLAAGEFRFSTPDAPVLPASVPFLAALGLPHGPLTLEQVEDTLDPRAADRLAAMFAARPPPPRDACDRAVALAQLLRSRPLTAALAALPAASLSPEASVALAQNAFDLGDPDGSARSLAAAGPDPAVASTGALALVRAELEGDGTSASRVSHAPPDAAPGAPAGSRGDGGAAASPWVGAHPAAAVPLLERRPPADPEPAARAVALAGAAAAGPVFRRWLARPELAPAALCGLALLAGSDPAPALAPRLHDPALRALRALVARLLVDSGQATARAAVYATADRDAGLIWELVRAVASEPRSAASDRAIAAAGAALVELARGAGPLAAREAATAALGVVPAAGSTPVLVDALARGPERLASAAAWALVQRRDVAHADPLLAYATSDRDARGIGAWALAMLGTRSQAAPLAPLLESLPRGAAHAPRRLMLAFALARLADDGRGWIALDDERTAPELGRALAAHVRAPATALLWVFPFVGYAPLGILSAGQSVQVRADGCWLVPDAAGWRARRAVPPAPRAGSAEPAAWLALGGARVPLARAWITLVMRRRDGVAAFAAPPGSAAPLPVADPAALAGCLIVRAHPGPLP